MILIPIVSALLFRAGGTDQWPWCPLNQKLWRWLMGIPIGLLSHSIWLCKHNLCWGNILICAGAYFIATNLFGYGDKTPILKYLPKPLKFTVSGLIFGFASFSVLGWWCFLQAGISALAFYIIFILDEKNIVKNPWVELLRGFFGTIVMGVV